MDYNTTLKALNEASLFDLYRLHIAIDKELDNPMRLTQVKKSLRVGMEISFYCAEENKLIPIKIVAIKRTKVAVQEIDTGRFSTIPFCMLNLEQVDTHIQMNEKNLDVHSLSVGDMVGFNHKDGEDIFGKVVKLNQKTVSIDTGDNRKWRVSYPLLFRVHDGDVAHDALEHLE